MSSTEIVAEIGSNYGGSLELAKSYIQKSAAAGATAAKFQYLTKESLVASRLFTGDADEPNPVFEGFQNLELSRDWLPLLKEECDAQGVDFGCTPFFLEAVDHLEEVGIRSYKIASGDLTFDPLLERVGATSKPVVLSTGGSDLKEVERALSILRQAGSSTVTLLHCVVSYPPQWDEVNLRAMQTLKDEFDCPVGVSDHSPGSVVPLAAIALGASFIEKHVTMDRSLKGPDHPFALTFEEFTEMSKQIRALELALGSGSKEPTPSEKERQHRYRRGVYDRETGRPSEKNSEGTIWLRPQHRR